MAKKKGGGSTIEKKVQKQVTTDLPIPESKLTKWSFEAIQQLIEDNNPDNSGKGGKKAKPKKGEVALDIETLKYDKTINLPNGLEDQLAEWRPLNRLAEVTRKRFPQNPFKTKGLQYIESGNLELDEIKPEELQEEEGEDATEKKEHATYLLENKQKTNKETLLNYCQLPQFVDRGYNDNFRAYFSSLAFIEQHCSQIVASQPGHYLWELIYPKVDESTIPKASSFGYYFVKLYIDGDWRLIVVNNELPFNKDSKSIFPQSSHYEFWSAILLKGLLAAAGEGNEHVVYEDPLFILKALLGPYLTEEFATSNVLNVLKQVNLAIDEEQKAQDQASELLNRFSTEEAAKESPIFDIPSATPLQTNFLVTMIDKNVEEASQLGLKTHQLYSITKCAYAQNKCLLQLVSTNIEFKGNFAYSNADIWTAEFEDELNFVRQDRMENSISSDFWITIEDLQNFATTITRLNHIDKLTSKIAMFGSELQQQFYLRVEENGPVYFSFQHLNDDPADIISEANAEKAKGKKGKGAPEPVDDGEFDKLPIGDTSSTISLKIETYDWQFPSSYAVNQETNVTLNREQLVRIENLDASKLYRVTINNRTQRTCIKCLSEKAVVIGNIEDILKSANDIQYQEEVDRTFDMPHDDKTQIVFIKTIDVTGETPFKLQFSPSKDILKHIQLSLTNVEDKSVVHDTIGVISTPNLAAGKYILTGLYKNKNPVEQSETSEEQPSEEEEEQQQTSEEETEKSNDDKLTYQLAFWNKQDTVEIEDVADATTICSAVTHGIYSPSTTGELFHYFIWVGEEGYANFTLKLNMDIPTTIKVVNQDNDVLQESNLRPNDDHLISGLFKVTPSDKKSASYICLTATVDETYAKYMLKRQQQLAFDSFSKRVSEDTDATELPEESLPPIEDDKKKGASKKAPPKKKKGEAEIGERVTKIPAKQTDIEIMESIPTIDPPSTEDDTSTEEDKKNLSEENFDLISVMYALQVNATTPNLVLEKVDLRAEKLAKLMESWSEEDPDRLTKSIEITSKLETKQQIQTKLSGNIIPLLPNYPHEHSSFPQWLIDTRGSLMNQYKDDVNDKPSESIPYSSDVFNERVSAINGEINKLENTQASLTASREEKSQSSYQLESIHESFMEEATSLKSSLESLWSKRTSYHHERQEEARIAAEEEAKRQAEAAKAAKGKKK
mmetsp:Transcript_714/g.1111  ORF Transcript_714/g.1111 Transcript_714/m.1111 type:complete len:1182 (+) Transcript_714:38-3583(+)